MSDEQTNGGNLEVRDVRTVVAVEERDSDDKPTRLSGYGAVYYNSADSEGTEFLLFRDDEVGKDVVERVEPGAFKNTLRTGQMKSFFNHNPDHVLGSEQSETMRAGADKTGLWYSVDLPDTQTGRDVATSIERGDVAGSSFAFIDRTPPEDRFTDEGDKIVRHLTDVEVFEQGPVTTPAYSGTTTGVRQAREMRGFMESYEQFKRDAGLVEANRQTEHLESPEGEPEDNGKDRHDESEESGDETVIGKTRRQADLEMIEVEEQG